MSTASNVINVGIGELVIAKPPTILQAVALGSCVGVAIIDPFTKVGGLAHVMLPHSENYSEKFTKPGKFADTAIKKLVEGVLQNGGSQSTIEAKIAGGAKMFKFQGTNSQVGDIGARNVEQVIHELNQSNVKITGQATGGEHGRTMILDLESGTVRITSLAKKEDYLI